ncbi:phosducin [Takifugu flavidus]|uniref:Phosducin n=1 Tax=Takifugu flavidus TaxID=433684 RepID=A0A5C6MTT0_9TELE|nr:phosducin [Takifugu flavidus]
MSDRLLELEESATQTGPKGVINDWRRFKLESMDQENLPTAKKELLRQMSSPNKSKDDSRGSLNRKMSVQEYEMLKEEDEGCLKKYRKRCMQEMHEKLSFGPRFDGVHDLDSGEAFLEVIEKEHHSTVVVVHIYKAGELLGNFLACTQHLNEEFFATDVEAFLNSYGLLPEKELPGGEDEENDVE